MQAFDYFFNIGGDFSAKISGMTDATGKFSAEVKRSQGLLDSFAGAMAKIDVVCESLSRFDQGIKDLGQSGISSAIEQLKHGFSDFGVRGQHAEGVQEGIFAGANIPPPQDMGYGQGIFALRGLTPPTNSVAPSALDTKSHVLRSKAGAHAPACIPADLRPAARRDYMVYGLMVKV